MQLAKVAGIFCLSLSLMACESAGPKETGGTLIGAGLGGLLGSQLGGGGAETSALIGLGVLLGGWAGSEVGKSLDRADRLEMERATHHALEDGRSGRPVSWHNPQSGHYGDVTPKPVYRGAEGQYCREYQQTVVIGQSQEQAYGTACRQPDGSWRIMS